VLILTKQVLLHQSHAPVLLALVTFQIRSPEFAWAGL
jgi:hypothetical protein